MISLRKYHNNQAPPRLIFVWKSIQTLNIPFSGLGTRQRHLKLFLAKILALVKIMGYQKRLVPDLPNGIGRERCCAPLARFTIVTDITSKMMSLWDFKVGVINAMKYLCGEISW
jgi:hypothetical protein